MKDTSFEMRLNAYEIWIGEIFEATCKANLAIDPVRHFNCHFDGRGCVVRSAARY